jgi:hypothetical protein
MAYVSLDLGGVTGIVYERTGATVRAECFRGERSDTVSLDEAAWRDLYARARALGVSVRADTPSVRYMELVCASALASIFAIHSLFSLYS